MIDCYVYTTATTYIFDYDFHNSLTNRLKTICNAYLFEGVTGMNQILVVF